MAQITWRNINAPDFGSANQLAQAGAQQVSAGIEGLQGLAREQAAISNHNYQTGVEQNTARMMEQLGAATTQEQLDAVDTEQFGTQINRSAIADMRAQQQAGILDRAIQKSKLELDEKKANQLGYMNDGNGGIWSTDPNTGEAKQVGTYTKQFAPKSGSGKGSTDVSSELQAILRSDADNFNDPAKYKDHLNNKLKLANVPSNKVNAIVEDNMQYFNSLNDLKGTPYEELANIQKASLDTDVQSLNSQLDQFDNHLNLLLGDGVTRQMMEMQRGESANLEALEKMWGGSSTWNRQNSVEDIYQNFYDKLKRTPTQAEMEYVLNQSRRDDGLGTRGSIKAAKAIDSYMKNVITNTHANKLFTEYSTIRNAIASDAESQVSRLSREYANKLRSSKRKGVVPEESQARLEISPYTTQLERFLNSNTNGATLGIPL